MREMRRILTELSEKRTMLIFLKDGSSISSKTTKVSIKYKGVEDSSVQFFAEVVHFYQRVRVPSILPILIPKGAESAEITFRTNMLEYDLNLLGVVCEK